MIFLTRKFIFKNVIENLKTFWPKICSHFAPWPALGIISSFKIFSMHRINLLLHFLLHLLLSQRENHAAFISERKETPSTFGTQSRMISNLQRIPRIPFEIDNPEWRKKTETHVAFKIILWWSNQYQIQHYLLPRFLSQNIRIFSREQQNNNFTNQKCSQMTEEPMDDPLDDHLWAGCGGETFYRKQTERSSHLSTSLIFFNKKQLYKKPVTFAEKLD